MKKRIIQFLTTYFLFVLLFVLQKPIFMVYYHDLYTNVSLGDYFRVMWHGLPLDLSLAGYLTAIPGLLLIASAWTNSSILRRIRQGYFGVIAFIMACIFIIDLGLYGFWGFRLDATPVFYFFSSPKDAMASVSFWFVLLGILSMLIYAAILYFIFYCVLIREKKPLTSECLACTPFADSGTFHPYPGRIQRIHHEFEQGVFQSGPTHESCSHQSGIQFHVFRHPPE